VRRALLVSINDTYRIEGLYGGSVGGFARVRALRQELEREHPDLLLLHAGDLFFPSLLSRVFKGEQMVDGLNRLDGDPDAFDGRLFATFGNHEFDKGKLKDAAIVDARVDQSRFTWLAGNLEFLPGEDGKPLVGGPNLVRCAHVESGGIRFGLFGLTIDTSLPAYARLSDRIETARELAARLRQEGAEVVVGLTHLDLAQDLEILSALGEAGPDLILGGHEHTVQRREVGGRWVCKADADAASACLVEVTVDGAGRVTVGDPAWEALAGETPKPDPDLAQAASDWVARHARTFCGNEGLPPTCLDEVVGYTRTELEGEETKIRTWESSLGDWLADLMLEAFAGEGAQVAFVNSGSLRLNRDIPAGSALKRRDVEELFEYPAELKLLRISGATLQKVAAHAVEGWSGKGWWLQVGGFAFRHDPEGNRALDLTLLGPGGPRPVDPDEEILAVATDYLVNPAAGDQDGYRMLEPGQVIASGGDLKALALGALAAAGAEGIAPLRDGRICNPPEAQPCQAVPGL
jgi:2',3'-cyclic-nucleotide 2'-phosphodiesterase (5'-nucleotidase family)